MVEGVSAADEWLQEAVMSDIFHQREPDRKKKKKATKRNPNTLGSFIENIWINK